MRTRGSTKSGDVPRVAAGTIVTRPPRGKRMGRIARNRAAEQGISPLEAIALQRSEEKYRSLFASIDEGFCTIEVLFDEHDKPIDYRFLEINPTFEKQTGITGALGMRMLEIAPGHETFWFETYGKVALTGEPIRLESFASQLDRWFDVNAFRVGTPEERTVSVLFSDITERKRGEEALRQSEERYRMLLDGVEDYAIFMMDAAGQVVSWNAGAQRIKGYSADEIIGQNFSRFFPADDIEAGRPAEVLLVTARNGRHVEQGMRVRKDGTQFLADTTFTALRDSAGLLQGFSEFSHDLSEREDLRAKYRILLDASLDAMIVVDMGGSIVLANAQAEKQFGYDRGELLGLAVTTIVPIGVADRLPEYDPRSVADPIIEHVATDAVVIGRRKDAIEFPIEIMLSPLAIAEGVFMTAVVHDITARVAAEASLAGQARLLDLAHDAIVVRDPDSSITYWSKGAERTYGWSAAEATGQVTHALLRTVFPESLEAVNAALAEVGDWTGEIEHTTRDGRAITVESRQSVERDARGKVRTILEINRDISVRKAAELQLVQTVGELKRSNEELGHFAYIASHDLQEPLRMVASYTQLLSKRYKGRLDADADEFIAFAVDGASRMQRLIEDLLSYSRVETSGSLLLDISSEAAFEQALMNLHQAIVDSGAIVTHDPLPRVQADETQLVQLFQNLIGNAIKYQNPGTPRVRISATQHGIGWSFAVTDNGMGIDQQYLERIFGMFQRLHKRDQFSGTGMGLAICRKIVERHGGSLTVESRPGHGSTFTFVLASSGSTS